MEIFLKLSNERLMGFNSIKKILSGKFNLIKFIKYSLRELNQDGYLSDKDILTYIKKYKQIMDI